MMISESTVYDWFKEILASNQRVYYSNDVIHVSEVSGCLRKAYYTRTTPLKPSEALTIIMSIGNGLHGQLQELLASRGWRSEVEVAWNFKHFKLVGHIDLYHPRENLVIELKTTNKLPDNPYQGHLMQLNSYLAMIGANRGYIIYISRNGFVRVFQHRLDKKLWSETIKRAYRLHFSLKNNTPPKPEPGPLCKYCPFKWKCFSERG